MKISAQRSPRWFCICAIFCAALLLLNIFLDFSWGRFDQSAKIICVSIICLLGSAIEIIRLELRDLRRLIEGKNSDTTPKAPE